MRLVGQIPTAHPRNGRVLRLAAPDCTSSAHS